MSESKYGLKRTTRSGGEREQDTDVILSCVVVAEDWVFRRGTTQLTSHNSSLEVVQSSTAHAHRTGPPMCN